ncbi:MAG TPA: hypothetical protein VKR61_08375 [Bryobacteraceae bacterium]|nr:hypothetical protein [Bryobacteraceae bacterium]
MNANRKHYLLAAAAVICGVFAPSGGALAAAKANHHDGKQLIGDRVKTDGIHEIHKKGDYTASVEVRNGKVAGVHVKHPTKGEVPVKKYKTNKKMAKAGGTSIYAAAFLSPQSQDLGTVYIGYSYIDDYGNEEIYWFPEEMILDGETGAIEYVPTS